jgi:predicted DNA-binding mobile mystery protein A
VTVVQIILNYDWSKRGMKPEFRKLRVKQLERMLQPLITARGVSRPQKGWIRAIREVTGITLREVAQRLGGTAAGVAYLEKSEADYRISLGKLREAADALGCELVYALVPKIGSVQALVEQGARTKAAETVRAVEHTMALEDQAVGRVDEKIEEHTKRVLKTA